MNIQVQLCGIALMILLLLLSNNRKSIRLHSKQAFIAALCGTLVALVLDVLSIIAIVNAHGHFTVFTRAICKAYLISLVWMCFSMNFYTTVSVGAKSSFMHYHRIISQIFICLSSFIIPFLPIYIHHTSRTDLYSYGPAVLYTYLAAFIFIIVNCYILIKYKKKLSKRRWISGMNWMVLLVVAAIVQFLNNSLLIIGFSSALGILIVYIRLENPESFIERETGCFNDLAFNTYLEQCYNRGERISMMIVQFANPHYLYERYYTDNINLFLKEFCKTLDESTKGNVFRYREWEFVITFSRKINLDEAANKLYSKLDRIWEIEGEGANIDLIYTKIPNSFIARDAESMLEMMRAFRRDYSNSSDRHLFIGDEWAANYRREQNIEDVIVSAIKDDRIKVFYQPIYSTAAGRFLSAEALVRIVDTDGNIIPPGAFIPVAEDTGLILQIGIIVFKKACQFMVEHKLYEKGIHYLEINLSAIQCMRSDLADEFKKVIDEVGIDPSMINLEITESKGISSPEILISNMKKMIDMGITFSLDDFGTGYSNLDYLLELPIEIVKFDRKMTLAYFENEKRQAVIGSVINMVKAADLEIVAEGVEEQYQLDELAGIDIDFIQGYYFSKPVPEEEFLRLLDAQTA